AFPHLAVPNLPRSRLAGLFRAAQNAIMASLAGGCFLLFLWLVESVLPVARFLFHRARLFPGRPDGSLSAGETQSGCPRPPGAAGVRGSFSANCLCRLDT